jgi:hypothetical protein
MGNADRKYLDRYAEPEAMLADRLGTFGHALVVPAYGEGESLVEMLESVPRGPLGEVLVVLVVNGKSSSAAWVHEANGAVLARLESRFDAAPAEIVSRDPPAHLLAFGPGSILVIDRASRDHRFPDDQGVGLARKMGVDLAARLHAAGKLVSPILHTTDADVVLPEDYFERPGRSPGAMTLLYPFTHVPDRDPALARAALLYEISLRYYVLGLRFAGSPYAHHTIGSTIATRAETYVRVRGFPKRDAGEDFYFLSKAAKLGPVVPLPGRAIAIRGRASERVPFGTGAAVRRIAGPGAAPFTMYDPRLFLYLRAWLRALEEAGGDVREACSRESLDPEPLAAAAAAMGAHGAISSARRRSTSNEALRRHLETWFDAFRTLKLVHILQRAAFPARPWADALREAPFTRDAIGASDAGEDLDRLHRLCERLAAREAR